MATRSHDPFLLAGIRRIERCSGGFTMGEQADPETRTSVWWPRIVSAVLGIIVTVTGAVIVQRLQAREPRLVYSSVETVPFNGPNNVVGIYQIVLRDDGKTEIESISCYIRIPGAKIEQYRTLAAPSLSTTATVANDAVRVDIPNLNPGETTQISILASNPSFLPNRPEISVRGKGVTGEPQAPAGNSPSESPRFYILVLTAATALASTSLIRLVVSKRSGGGSQAEALASICQMHGLSARAERYAAATKVTYYAEADRLGEEAYRSNDPNVASEVKRILTAMSAIPSMRDGSRSIVLYQLARISAKEGSAENANRYIAEARKLAEEEVDGRRRIDPLFNDVAGVPTLGIGEGKQ